MCLKGVGDSNDSADLVGKEKEEEEPNELYFTYSYL